MKSVIALGLLACIGLTGCGDKVEQSRVEFKTSETPYFEKGNAYTGKTSDATILADFSECSVSFVSGGFSESFPMGYEVYDNDVMGCTPYKINIRSRNTTTGETWVVDVSRDSVYTSDLKVFKMLTEKGGKPAITYSYK